MTYPTPPIPPVHESSAAGSPLFTEDSHGVRTAVMLIVGVLLWLGILLTLNAVV